MDQAPPASELQSPSGLAQNTVIAPGSGSSGGNVPPGAITMYCSATPPSGWLIMDGTAISRSTYSTLFTIIGTNFGAGDGSTTFNLPDMRGRVPVGQGTHADVSSLNASDGQAVANRRPKHRTSLTDPGHVHAVSKNNTGGGALPALQWQSVAPATNDGSPIAGAATSATTGITVGTGVANDALDAPSYLVITYIIKT